MRLEESVLNKLCQLAMRAAGEASAAIQGLDRDRLVRGHKSGGSSEAAQLVTEADHLSQGIILDHLFPTLQQYSLGLLTEEAPDDHSRFVQDYFWCIDPLDGTLPYAEAQPGYAVSIALVSKEGEPVLGVAADPVHNRLYHAIQGAGAFVNGQALSPLSKGHTLSIILDPGRSQDPAYHNIIGQLQAEAIQWGYTSSSVIEGGGAVMNALGVLDQAPALYFKLPKSDPGGGSLWDFAASALIVSEAGGKVSDMQGEPLDLNQSHSLFMNRCGVLYSSVRGIESASITKNTVRSD